MTETSQAKPSAVWRRGDLMVVYAINVLAAATVAAGWWGTSGSLSVDDQVRWANVAVAGLLVATVGDGYWWVRGRRAILGRRRRMAAQFSTPHAASPSVIPLTAPDLVVAGERMTRYHRPACPAVVGKSVRPQPVDEHRRAGRAACPMCNS